MASKLRVLGVAAAGGLVFSGAAAAGSHPFLFTSNLDPYVKSQELIVAVPSNDPAVSVATMYVGPGTSLAIHPGTTFGEADADFMANADYGNTIFQLTGDVVSANPVEYENNACAPGLHAAVWLARMSPLFLDVTITVPIYVDYAKPAQQPYASYVLEACMPSPYVPYPAGALLGGRLLDFQLYLSNVQSARSGRWTAVVTPFAAGGGTDLQGSAEAQSVVSQGSISALSVRRTVKRHGGHKRYFARIRGRVTTSDGTGIPADIQVYELFGRDGGSEVASLRAGGRGSFTLKVRQKRTASYGIVATALGNEIKPPACTPVLEIGFGPLSCASVTSSDFEAVRITKKVRIPRGGAGIPASRAAAILHRRLLSSRTGTLSP